MKLITIGTSRDAYVRLNSKYASPIHAELLLLDNGDILLTDKRGNNGTFVQDRPVEPGKEISVRRGDKIRFADVYLDWNQVPQIQPVDLTKVKGVYGIGSNFRNKFQLTGATVSRYHATFKEMKNGKWFIRDHSRNGTTLNGNRLAPEMDYRVKANDVIVCGGVPCPNPVQSSPWGMVWKVAAAVAAVVAIVFGIRALIDDVGINPKFEDMTTASALVYGQYHYTAKIVDDPFVGVIPNWPTEFCFSKDPKTEEVVIMATNSLVSERTARVTSSTSSIGYTGTAFFVSKDGKMVTNRHVAAPWLDKENIDEVSGEINQQMMLLRNEQIDINELTISDVKYVIKEIAEDEEGFLDIIDQKFVYLIYYYLYKTYWKSDRGVLINEIKRFNSYIMRFKNSPIEVSGKMDYIGVAITNHKYSSVLEFDRCTVLSVSENPEIDLAIMQLNSNVLPPSVKFYYDLNKCVMNPKDIKVQGKTYYSAGYPKGYLLGLDNLNGGLQPTMHEVKVSKLPGEYDIQLQGEVIGGCSGSPICDRRGRLVGVVWGKSSLVTTMSLGVHAKYVKEMNDKIY